MNYYFLCIDDDIDDGAHLDKHDELSFKDFHFDEAEPLLKYFNDPIEFYMDTDDEDARELYDILDNTWSMLIVSELMMNIFKEFDCGDVEFLPIQVINQRNKPIKEQYYIVNTLQSVDYIDENKSTIKHSRLIPEHITFLRHLVIKEENLPDGRDLFRTSKFNTNAYMVSEALKNKLDESDLEGFIFIPAAEIWSTKHL